MGEISTEAYLVYEWCLISLCIAVVTTRIWVRVWRGAWSFWISDALLVVALLAYIAFGIGDIVTITNGEAEVSVYTVEAYAEWSFAGSIMFDSFFYIPRFSLLAFYYELFPVSERGLRILLYTFIAYNFVCFITTIGVDVFWCGFTDISQNWLNVADGTCTLATSAMPMFINWGIGMSCELLVFFLPMPLLWKLKKMDKREKAGLTVIFMLGIITITVSTTRFVFSVQSIFSRNTITIENTEMGTQIMVVALPALRPLLGILKEKARVSYGSRSPKNSRTESGALGGSTLGGSTFGSMIWHKRGVSGSSNLGVDEPTKGAKGGNIPDLESGILGDDAIMSLPAATQRPPWESLDLPRI